MEPSEKYVPDETKVNERTVLISASTSSPGSDDKGYRESKGVYKSRWRSIRVMYLTMFLSSVSFSICMSSLYPYMRVLDPSASTNFLGWVVASYSVGQFVASPIFGAWSNIRAKTREPLVVSILINVFANVLYMYLESIHKHAQVYLLVARAFVGFGAGNVGVVRSYVAAATNLSERISAMANLSAFQSAGFIFGNLFQTAMVPLGYPGPLHEPELHLDMYSSTGLFSGLVGIVNILLLFIVFKEHNIIYEEEYKYSNGTAECKPSPNTTINNSSHTDPDYIAVFTTIFLFFSVLFIFAVFETIVTPFGMHMFAWEKAKATLLVGIMLGCAGLVAVVVFAVIKLLAKRFNERNLLVCGFMICILGYISYLPWGNSYPAIQYAEIGKAETTIEKITYNPNVTASELSPEENSNRQKDKEDLNVDVTYLISNERKRDRIQDNFRNILQPNKTNLSEKTKFTKRYLDNNNEIKGFARTQYENTTFINITNLAGREAVGCPYYFDWCMYTPAIFIWQYILGTFFISVGYPACSVISYTIFSKVLGPKPQGLWMGWLTASGSLARTLGPVFVSQVYDKYGPRVTFTAMAANIILTLIVLLIIYKRLVPYKVTS